MADEQPGISVFICTRGSARKRCKCGRFADRPCTFPLKGRKAGQTCGQPLCSHCFTTVGSLELCPVHAVMEQHRCQT